jgi:hypothetical protein
MAYRAWFLGGVLAFLAGLFARRKREPKRHQNVPEYTRTAVPDGEVVIDDPAASGKKPDSAPNVEHPLNNNDVIRSPG